MTKLEEIQMKKNEALNKIRKIYNPMYNFPYDNYSESGSYGEQREFKIECIIEELEKEIQKIKHRNPQPQPPPNIKIEMNQLKH